MHAPIVAWLLHWLHEPIRATWPSGIAPWAAWHARLMVLAWNVVLPSGAMIARFGKVLPGSVTNEWPLWWRLHRVLQFGGLALVAIAVALAVFGGAFASRLATCHVVAGWIVVSIGVIQLAGGLLRGTRGGPTEPVLRGDHYDMTLRRVVFERVHKTLGWLVIVPVWFATAAGLLMVDAPRWMPILLATWWAALLAAFVTLQRAGRCVDTYRSIWGDSPQHPGNRPGR